MQFPVFHLGLLSILAAAIQAAGSSSRLDPSSSSSDARSSVEEGLRNITPPASTSEAPDVIRTPRGAAPTAAADAPQGRSGPTPREPNEEASGRKSLRGTASELSHRLNRSTAGSPSSPTIGSSDSATEVVAGGPGAAKAPVALPLARKEDSPPAHHPTVSRDDLPSVDEESSWKRSFSQDALNRLLEQLFESYHKEVPPVPQTGGALRVGVGLDFVKFLGFDAVEGTMEGTVDMRLFWTDRRLSFSAVDFFNTTWERDGDKIPVRSDLIWTPDVTVLNQVGNRGKLLRSDSTPLLLGDEGFRNKTGVNVMWSRPLDVKGSCTVAMGQYPFDTQTCHLDIGSWASSEVWMELIPQAYFEEHSVHTSEFHVNNITMTRHDEHVEQSDQTFQVVRYSLVLQRYAHYYLLTFILPMVAMTLLTAATMWMNADQIGQRINAGTKLLLCVVSIIFLTAKNRPAIHGDIWMDRFQTHCLAACVACVLQSLFMDYVSKQAVLKCWNYTMDRSLLDSTLRGVIIFCIALVIFVDARKVERYYAVPWLYASFRNDSTKLMGFLVYVMLAGLVIATTANMFRTISTCLKTAENSDSENAPGDKEIGKDVGREVLLPNTRSQLRSSSGHAASSNSPFLAEHSSQGLAAALPAVGSVRSCSLHRDVHRELELSPFVHGPVPGSVVPGLFLPAAGFQDRSGVFLSEVLKLTGSSSSRSTDTTCARYTPLSDGGDASPL